MRNVYEVEWKYYDAFYDSFTDDVEFYREMFGKLGVRGPVLELFCGTGRIISRLMEYDPYGMDISERMVAIARDKGLGERVMLGDARSTFAGRKFQAVLIPLNSIQMFDRADRLAVLRNAKRHLLPGGYIFVDMFNGFPFPHNIYHLGDIVEWEGKTLVRSFVPRFYPGEDRVRVIYFYEVMEPYRKEIAYLDLYLPEREEIEEELRLAGFDVIEVYGGYDMSAWSEDSEKMIFVGRVADGEGGD